MPLLRRGRFSEPMFVVMVILTEGTLKWEVRRGRALWDAAGRSAVLGDETFISWRKISWKQNTRQLLFTPLVETGSSSYQSKSRRSLAHPKGGA